jgi:hypothetical protein
LPGGAFTTLIAGIFIHVTEIEMRGLVSLWRKLSAQDEVPISILRALRGAPFL